MKKLLQVIKVTAIVLLCAVELTLGICPLFDIHVFRSGFSQYQTRLECVDGYYVLVYEQDVCSYQKDGEPNLSIGYCGDITDYDWKHQEMLGVVPFKRFLCFSKETEPETYHLLNEDGTVLYGFVFVIRADSGTIHYYYQRSFYTGIGNTRKVSPYQENEYITFSYDGETIELENYCRFSSDVDFTTGEHILYIGDEPCYFR